MLPSPFATCSLVWAKPRGRTNAPALTAAAVAALTVYDMTKALDKGIEIRELYLVEKTGGKSGDYKRGV